MQTKGFKDSLRRGFTLIELMIVIVILGVLMGTILPRLTGAQARARDTGRIADMNTISQAMETYFDDFGEYPGAAGTAYCLDDAVLASPGESIKSYLKGGVPKPPSTSQVTKLLGKDCTGLYLYAPLKNRGLAKNGYILSSDLETYQNANYDGNNKQAIDVNTSVSDFTTVKGNTLKAVDEDVNGGAARTIYILFN